MDIRLVLITVCLFAAPVSFSGCATMDGASSIHHVTVSPRRADPFQGGATYRFLGQTADVSYANIRRYVQDVELKPGLERHEIRSALRDALDRVTRAKRRVNAVAIHGRIWDPYGEIKLGQAEAIMEMTPNGEWGDAGKPGPMKITFRVFETYAILSDLVSTEYRGKEAGIINKDGQDVWVTNTETSRAEEFRVGRLSPGDRVVLLERRLYAAGESVSVRYHVWSVGDGRVVQGWVDGHAISEF